MDPVSATIAAAGLVKVATQTSNSLFSLYNGLKQAPDLILALANEIADVGAVLDRVGDATSSSQRLNDTESAAFITALCDSIRQARILLSELDTLVAHITKEKPTLRRVKWLLKSRHADVLQGKIKLVRARLNDLLLAYNTFMSARIQLELQSIRIEMREIHDSKSPTSERRLSDVSDQLTDVDESISSGISRSSTLVEHMPLGMKDASPAETAPVLAETHKISALNAIEHNLRSTVQDSEYVLHLVLGRVRSQCSADCPCKCHISSDTSKAWKLPKNLETVLGQLFIGYAGNPISSSPCTMKKCAGRKSVKLQVTYGFPMWFLRYKLHLFAEATNGGSLTVALAARRRVEPHVTDFMGNVALGNVDGVKLYLSQERWCLNDIYFLDGSPALSIALRTNRKNISIIKHLLQNGADPDQKDDSGVSPRQHAASLVLSRQLASTELQEIETLFTPERCYGDFEFSFLHEVVLGICPIDLNAVLQTGDPQVQAQLHARDSFDFTPLVRAVLRDDLDAVRMLVQAGSWINDPEGRQCLLRHSLKAVKSSALDMLIEAGADVNRLDSYGSPLITAVRLNKLGAIKSLVAAGASLTRLPGQRTTLTSSAMWQDCDHVLRYLFEQGAPPEEENEAGDTVIAHAVMCNAHRSLAMLLEMGVNHRGVRHDGWTLLHEAADMGDIETLDLLAAHGLAGLDVSAETKNGVTALQVFEKRKDVSDDLRRAFQRLLRTINGGANGNHESEEDSDLFEDALESLDLKSST